MKWIKAFMYGLVILAIYHYFMSSEVIRSPGVLKLPADQSASVTPNQADQGEDLEQEMQNHYRKLQTPEDDLNFSSPSNVNDVGVQAANAAGGHSPAKFESNITDVNQMYRENPSKFFSNTPGSAAPPTLKAMPGAPGTPEAEYNMNLYQAYMNAQS